MKKTFALCVALLAIAACKTKQGYVEKGNALFAQGKYQDAAINYRKAIQKDAKYGDAYYRLGLAALQLNNPVEAYNSLSRAWQLEPNNLEVEEKFGTTCLELYFRSPQRPRKLYQQLQQVSAELLAQDPKSFEGLRERGLLAHEDRKPEEAISYFRQALNVKPWNPGVTTALVETLIETGRYPEAEKTALELITKDTNYGPIYDVMYRFYSDSNRAAEAENILKQKAGNNPSNPSYILQLAAHFARTGKPKEEQETLAKLANDPARFPNAQVLLGDYYLSQKRYQQAAKSYEAEQHAYPKGKLALQKRELGALLAAGKYDAAMQIVNQILAQNPKDELGLRMRADLLINTGTRENGAAAVEILQNLQSLHPNEKDPGLRLNLGRAYRLKGDAAAARAQFEEALRERKDFPEAQYELAKLYVTHSQPVEASQAANAAASLRPNDRQVRLLQAWTLINTGEAVKAKLILQQLIKEAPKDPQPHVQLAILALREGNYREAINLLEDLPKDGNPSVTSNLAAAYIGLKQFDKAQDVLAQGLKQSPGSVVLREQIAETTVLSGNYELALAEFQKLIAEEPKSARLHLLVGEIYQRRGDSKQSLAQFEQAYQLAPSDTTTAVVYAEALTHEDKIDQAKAVYRQLIQTHPDDLPALNNAAYFLSEHGDLNEAERLAEKVAEKAPGQPAYADTLGYVYLKKGQRDNAIRTFSDLVRRYPTLPAFHYHLGLALYQNGDGPGAKKELQKALAYHPGSLEPAIRDLLRKVG